MSGILTVVAPQAMAVSMQRNRKSASVREASMALHSTSSVKRRARLTLSITRWCTCSMSRLSWYWRCSGEVPMKVWIRAAWAGFSASPARSMSAALARASEQTTLSLTRLAISLTDWKSPSLAMANPASMTSTPMCSSVSATRIFSSTFIEQPGDCSPSRSVVSKMTMRSSPLLTAWAAARTVPTWSVPVWSELTDMA